jgi:hypothetical protein
MKSIKAGVLDIAYFDTGPKDGQPVIRAAQGRGALTTYPTLQRWWERISGLSMLSLFDPKLSNSHA